MNGAIFVCYSRGLIGSICQSLDKPSRPGFQIDMAKQNSTFDPIKALQAAQNAADGAAEILRSYFGKLKNVSEKDQAGLVSEADVASENEIRSILQREYPAQFLGEESFKKGDLLPTEGNWWIVDPLDGTTNYVYGLPFYCISIGLMWDGNLVLGLVDLPGLKTRYHAAKGCGAFKDKIPIHVSKRQHMKEAFLATGFFREDWAAAERQLKIFESLVYEVRGVRRIGAAAYDLCLVAEGVFDGFWEHNLKPWDTAAGTVLVEEAGGRVTDCEGRPHHSNSKSILATSAKMYAKLATAIHQIQP